MRKSEVEEYDLAEITISKEERRKYRKEPFLGDLGFYGGNYFQFANRMGELLGLVGWDSLNLVLEFEALYMTDPVADNAETVLSMVEDSERLVLEKCQLNETKIFLPKEIIDMIYDEKGLKELPKARLEYKNPNWKPRENEKQVGKNDQEAILKKEIKIKENLIDVKTGLSLKTLLEKSEEFERTIMDPNMSLIQEIIRGNAAKIVEGEHMLIQGDPEKTTAKFYMALIGLLSYKRSKIKNHDLLKSYLYILSTKMESDIVKFSELLNFIITQDSGLPETMNSLEINEDICSLLLISLYQQTGEDETKDSIATIISKNLNIQGESIQIFEILRNIYQLKGPKSWKKLAELLRKNDVKDEKKGKPNEKSTKNPLELIVDLISFAKLRKQVMSQGNTRLINSMTMESEDENDRLNMLFKKAILTLEIYNYTDEESNILLENHNIIHLLVRKEYSRVLDRVVFSSENLFESYTENESPSLEATPDGALKNLGNFLRVSVKDASIKKDLKLLRLYLILAHKDLISFKERDTYDILIHQVLKDMIQENILYSIKNREEDCYKVAQLLVGVMGWDPALCFKAFATESTIHMGYLLYSLYGCMNMDKLLVLGKGFRKQAKIHLETILGLVFAKVLAYSVATHFGIKPIEVVEKAMQREFKINVIEKEGPLALEEAAEGLLRELAAFERKKRSKSAKPLIYYVARSFKKDIQDEIQTTKDYGTFQDILFSICDGTLVIKLINSLLGDRDKGKDEDQETETETANKVKSILKNLFRLILAFRAYYSKKADADEVRNLFITFVESVSEVDKSEIWERFKTVGPQIILMCIMYEQGGVPNIDHCKKEMLAIIKEFIPLIKDPTKTFMVNTMCVMLGVNILNYDKAKQGVRVRMDLTIEDRMNIFFRTIGDIFFQDSASRAQFVGMYQQIYALVVKIKIDYVNAIHDPVRRWNVLREMLTSLQEFKVCSKPFVEALIQLAGGDISSFFYALKALDSNLGDITAKSMVSYLTESAKLLDLDLAAELKPALPESASKRTSTIDPDAWNLILRKIKEGTANSRDLFFMIDQEGDQSGAINETEFSILAGRLGLKLSPHRINEIFAKVKGNKAQSGGAQELNEEEFEQALGYLQEKNLQQALQLLGITPEMLTAILIRLVVLLVLVFVFIFLGIRAFAIGGTFGSIVNSLFPAVGGLALGKESDQDKGKLQEQNVKEATNKGFEITTSEQL